MAKYSSKDLKIEFDNAGGTLVDMSQYIRTFNGVNIAAVTQESHSFGDAWVEHLATGLRRGDEVELSGYYDDTATTGPDAIFNDVANGPSATTRTLKVTWGGTKTTSVETLIASYRRGAQVGQLHEFTVRLLPTGPVTET